MLMAHDPTMASNVVLLVMLILLSMMLLVVLMLVFMAHVHLHIPLVPSPVHHHLLSLRMPLIVHAVRIVVCCLRYG